MQKKKKRTNNVRFRIDPSPKQRTVPVARNEICVCRSSQIGSGRNRSTEVDYWAAVCGVTGQRMELGTNQVAGGKTRENNRNSWWYRHISRATEMTARRLSKIRIDVKPDESLTTKRLLGQIRLRRTVDRTMVRNGIDTYRDPRNKEEIQNSSRISTVVDRLLRLLYLLFPHRLVYTASLQCS